MSMSWGYGPTCLLDIFTVVFVPVTLPLCLSIAPPKSHYPAAKQREGPLQATGLASYLS